MCFIPEELNNAADILSRWYEGKEKKVKENEGVVRSVMPCQSELWKLHAEGHWVWISSIGYTKQKDGRFQKGI